MGGTHFPPEIYFKIFTKGLNVHYYSGGQMIEAGSKVGVENG